jgi:hypothetical protein
MAMQLAHSKSNETSDFPPDIVAVLSRSEMAVLLDDVIRPKFFDAICVCVNTNPMFRYHLQISTARNINISTDRAFSISPDTDSSRKRLDTCRRSSIVRTWLLISGPCGWGQPWKSSNNHYPYEEPSHRTSPLTMQTSKSLNSLYHGFCCPSGLVPATRHVLYTYR